MTRQRFSWNSQKARANLRKHGVEFELAVIVFTDPFAVVTQDQVVSHEWRWRTTGMLNDGRVLVAHTIEDDPDGGELIRIISARLATRSERRTYAEERRRHL